MKKYQYPLKQLLALREMELEQSQAKFADDMAAVQQEEQKLQQIEEQLAITFATKVTNITPRYFQQRINYINSLNGKVIDQKELINQAERQLEVARQELTEANIEVKRLNKHDEKLFEKWEEEAKREEVAMGDEIGVVRAFFKK